MPRPLAFSTPQTKLPPKHGAGPPSLLPPFMHFPLLTKSTFLFSILRTCIDNLQQARPNFPLFLQVKSHDGVDVMGNSHESRHCGQQHLLCHLRWQSPKFDPRRTWWPHVLPEDDDPVEENPVEDTSGSVNDSGEEKCAVLERRAAVVSLRRFH